MTLKAILFDLNGVIINDEDVHCKLSIDLLLDENIIATPKEYNRFCLGRGDRGLADLLSNRGRLVSEQYLQELILRKCKSYEEYIKNLDSLPTYCDLLKVLTEIKIKGFKIGLVSGTTQGEAKMILNHLQIIDYFDVIVGEDEVDQAKPDPQSYVLAASKLQQINPWECLAIEDTPLGIAAAKRAGMQVVGIANTYPFHFMQRCSNWAVDYLTELDWEWISENFTKDALDFNC